MKISEKYINQVWQKYPLEKRIQLEKLLDKKGETFQAINKFEVERISRNFEKLKMPFIK